MPGDLKLCGVLDGHQPLRFGDKAGEDVQQGRLPRARPAGDQDRLPVGHCLFQGRSLRGSGRRALHQIAQRGDGRRESSDRDDRVIHCGRRHYRVQPAAVDQSSIHSRRGAINSKAEGRENTFERGKKLPVAPECDVFPYERTGTLDPDLAGAVDKDVTNRLVGHQGFDGAESKEDVGDGLGQPIGSGRRCQAEQTLRLSRDVGLPEGDDAGGDSLSDMMDQAHGRSQTAPQALTHRPRPG